MFGFIRVYYVFFLINTLPISRLIVPLHSIHSRRAINRMGILCFIPHLLLLSHCSRDGRDHSSGAGMINSTSDHLQPVNTHAPAPNSIRFNCTFLYPRKPFCCVSPGASSAFTCCVL